MVFLMRPAMLQHKNIRPFRLVASRPMVKSASYIDCDASGLSQSAALLKQGGLVAFPTETVYGLGANALNESSVASIFTAKQRPITDPLIVHVLDKRDIYNLFDFDTYSNRAKVVCETLCDAFWPGPLTIIFRASKVVPPLVTASTGFVGLRSPIHPVARSLLQACQLPIAAPSANRFGHVSPTSSVHVMSDLHHVESLLILEDDPASTGGCSVGIESTVCRVSNDGKQVTILRCGAVTAAQISMAIGLTPVSDTRVIIENMVASGPKARAAANNQVQDVLEPVNGAVAPGQMLKHYSPDLPTFICADVNSVKAPSLVSADRSLPLGLDVANSMILDFGGALSPLSTKAKFYLDLSPSSNASEACQNVFAYLRLAESQAIVSKGVRVLLLPDLRIAAAKNETVRALWERLNRAASGVFVSL